MHPSTPSPVPPSTQAYDPSAGHVAKAASKVHHGAGMDRVSPSRRKAGLWWAGALLGAAGLLAGLSVTGRTPALPGSALRFAQARLTPFQELLTLQAQTEAAEVQVLDAEEGGRVDAVLVADGAPVVQGQPLLRLSSPTRQAELLARQAELSQQTANLALQRSMWSSAQAQWRREMTQAEHQAQHASRQLARSQTLAAQGFISAATLEEAQAAASLQTQLLSQLKDDAQHDLTIRRSGVQALERAVAGLSAGLRLQQGSLERLIVKAPLTGQLSGMSLQVGATVRQGDRMGQIRSQAQGFRLSAQVEEHLLDQFGVPLGGWLESGGRRWPVRVVQTHPQIQSGRFRVTLAFDKEQPETLALGQSQSVQLSLGQPRQALTIPDGHYLREGRDRQVFVRGRGQDVATLRVIKLGRRSQGLVEVLEGLDPQDEVLVDAGTTPWPELLRHGQFEIK